MESDVHICVVQSESGDKHYLTLLPPDLILSKGLLGEAVIGVLLRPLDPSETITPEVFAPNGTFVAFMHEMIAKHTPDDPACKAEAKRQGNGWIYVIDGRTKTPQGEVPPEDIIGAFKVASGEIVPGGYQPNSRHLLLSSDGFFRLSPELYTQLVEELRARTSAM
ncbi:MAG: hypothetical protein QM783_01495 [Phycisphaerales bacterium]